MAITIKTPSITPWGRRSVMMEEPAPSAGILKTHTIAVNIDGSILLKDTKEKILNLGKQGDSNVTLLKFDVSSLSESKDLSQYYFQLAVKNLTINSVIGTFLVNNYEFLIPSIISDYAGDYEFIIILRDKSDQEGSKSNQKEFFISDAFKAKIEKSTYDNLVFEDGTEITLDAVNVEELEIFKPSIKINGTLDEITSDSQVLGNKGDRYVLYFDWSEWNRPSDINEIYMVIALNTEEGVAIPIDPVEESKFWVPFDITANAGEYQIGFLVKGPLGEKTYSFLTNLLTLKVQDNWLTESDLDFDFTDVDGVFLSNSAGELLQDIDGYLLYTMEE